MPKLVQIRGNQCGGKTTTVNQYIERMGRKKVFSIHTSQGNAKCTETNNGVIVLGVYDGKTGGCDRPAPDSADRNRGVWLFKCGDLDGC